MRGDFVNLTGNQKPLLITLAAFIGILILTAAAAFLIHARGVRRFRSAADAPYPYAWTEKNLITLTLDSADASDGVWTTDTEGGGTVLITIGEAENGKTEVTLRPITEGRAEVVFTLTDGETRLAEARFTVEAEQDERGGLYAIVTDHSEEAASQGISGGENTGYPFNVKTDEFNIAVIHITDPAIKAETYEIPPESAEETTEEISLENAEEIPPETGETAGDEFMEDDYSPDEYDYVPNEAESAENEFPPTVPEEPENTLWTAYTSDEIVADISAVRFENGGVNIELAGKVIGSADISVSKEEADLTYIFTFEFDGAHFILTDTRTAKYTPPPTPYPLPDEEEAVTDTESGLYEEGTAVTDEVYNEETAMTDGAYPEGTALIDELIQEGTGTALE